MEDQSEGLFASFITKLFGGRDSIPIEQAILAAKKHGELKTEEVSMLLNVLRLGRRQVREIMIPRTDIVCTDVSEPIAAVAELIIEHGHSRIPVYRENRDNIVGIIHAKDLLRTCATDPEPPSTEAIMRTPLFIPDTKNVYDMLQVFKENKIHLAIALDEYGGTSGLVTFEDVLEEIVGEIEDEYDPPRPDDIQLLDDGSVLVSGRTPLTDLELDAHILIETDQVDTISGYVCSVAGRVPEAGEVFEAQGLRFEVREADPKQVHWIVIRRTQGPDERSNGRSNGRDTHR